MKDERGISLTIRLLAITLSWALMTLLVVTFYFAYFSPSRQVLIDINKHGEMTFEAIVLVLVWLLTTWNVLTIWKRIQ